MLELEHQHAREDAVLFGNVAADRQAAGLLARKQERARAQQLAQVSGVVMLVLAGVYVGILVIQFYTGYLSGVMNAGGAN